jgi:hypothetical protein
MHDDGQIQVNPYESVIRGRGDQASPVLTEVDISRVERFGNVGYTAAVSGCSGRESGRPACSWC